jgi:23S rRNA (guanine2445-N2)-methyltransferase
VAQSVTYRYQETREFFAQVAHPIEEMGAAELTEFGAKKSRPAYRGVFIEADHEALYRIVYKTRLCTRVLAPLIRFECHSDRYLYKTASAIDWTEFMSNDDTFAVDASVSQSRITHSKFAALRLKDAVVDFFRDSTGDRPSIDRRNPDVWLHLHIQNNHATISLDLAGGSLHRRGYREASVEAPLQETVAAAIIRMTGWQADVPFIDPMCGSGTLLAEALMHACRIPAGYLRRRFGFERMPDFDHKLWKKVRTTSNDAIRELPGNNLITGSDADQSAVDAARTNLAHLPHGNEVRLSRKDFFSYDAISDSILVTNPPYGLRIGRRDEIEDFYRQMGDFLKQRCTGSVAYIYAGKRELLKSVGLRTTSKKALVNGALDGRLARYDLY